MATDKRRISVYFDDELMDKFEQLVFIEHVSKNKLIELLVRQAIAKAEEENRLVLN